MEADNHCCPHEYTLWVDRSGSLYVAGVKVQFDQYNIALRLVVSYNKKHRQITNIWYQKQTLLKPAEPTGINSASLIFVKSFGVDVPLEYVLRPEDCLDEGGTALDLWIS